MILLALAVLFGVLLTGMALVIVGTFLRNR